MTIGDQQLGLDRPFQRTGGFMYAWQKIDSSERRFIYGTFAVSILAAIGSFYCFNADFFRHTISAFIYGAAAIGMFIMGVVLLRGFLKEKGM